MRRHANRDGAARLAEVPRERRLRGQDDREPAGPERLDEPLDGLGHFGHEGTQRREARDEDGRRRLPAAALRIEQPLHGGRAERVGGDAVDGVGGDDDELAAADRLACLAHARQKLRLIAAVEEGGHDASQSIREAPRAPRTSRPQGRRRAVAERQVGMRRRGAPAVLREDLADRRSLPLAVLDDERAARVQEPKRDPAQDPHDVEPVAASVERGGRIEQAHFGITRDRGIRNVRRIGDDHRDRPVELGEGIGEVDECEPRVRRADGTEVLLRPHERVDGVLGGMHARVGHLGRQGEGERAAARSEIDGDGGGGCRGRERVDGELRDDLGLWPRDEDAGADPQLEVAEGGRAGQMLQGLARRAALDELLEPSRRVLFECVAADRAGLDGAATDAEDVRREQFGVDDRIGHARAREPFGGGAQGGGEIGGRRDRGGGVERHGALSLRADPRPL